MNIIEKLMFSRQLTFSDGQIKLFSENLLFVPSDFVSTYTETIKDNTDAIKNLYLAAKKSTKEKFGIAIGKEYGFAFRDYTKWFADIIELSGWGMLKWKDIDEAGRRGVISLTNSIVASSLKGKVQTQCDHIMRGFIAGGASVAFKEDMDVIEEKCIALGDPECIFVIGKNDVLKRNYNIANSQVP